MTLVVAIIGKKSIWMLTDRRLTFKAIKPRDDARKLLFLETIDGAAILGYAGLGLTGNGTEPSDWMARVLRGFNLPLEQSLSVLAHAAQLNLPKHINPLTEAHHILVTAFVNKEPRLYSIDLLRAPNSSNYLLRYTRYATDRQLAKGQMDGPRIAISGSGAGHLLSNRLWVSNLRKMVAAHDADRISPQTVASKLAELNHKVARASPTVGHRCIVTWRLQDGGGGHEFFTGRQKDVSSSFVWIPSITHGRDINAVLQASLPFILPMLDAGRRGDVMDINKDAINVELSKLPVAPDDRLY